MRSTSSSSASLPTPSRCLLLFDLDGTLLLTQGAGARAMQRAGQDVWGPSFSVEMVNFGGSLDPVIIRQAAQLGAFQFTEELHLRFRSRYVEELVSELSTSGNDTRALPGVMALLDQLRARDQHTLGLLTGNYEETGMLKLRAVGIDPAWFSPRVWGDAGATRPDLVRVAMQHPGASPPERVVVIGDTDKDVHCAKVNGCKVVAVATGAQSREELREAGADLILSDLSDPGALFDFLDRL